MEQQSQQQPASSQARSAQHPQLQAIIPPSSSVVGQWTANSTPVSSPGLFSPSNPRPRMSLPAHAATEASTPAVESPNVFLHPLQNHKVRETHKAMLDLDFNTGRKLINQYEVIEEIGRGMHGKVKLARNLWTQENVAIKIIPRFSKKRRLGKVSAMAPQQDKSKKEIAILKKIRHPNVVALLEVIDDPELQKIYMVLEHVELGEVVWRKKGLPHICAHERRRIEKEMRGETTSIDEERYDKLLERRQALKDFKRARLSELHAGPADYWSIENGAAADDDENLDPRSRISSGDDLAVMERISGSIPSSMQASRATSRAPSRSHSVRSMGQAIASLSHEQGGSSFDSGGDIDTPGPLRSNPASSTALDGTMYGAYVEDPSYRGRSPSMADSIISHMSSVDYSSLAHDPFTDDYSYVPCFTIEQARTTFRDTVLGLEYLHYQGVVHRDIKPGNLLWTKDHRVKISDFGVSYFGRPIRDGEPYDDIISESEAQDFDDDLELSKTVGTPAFFAPELCYTDPEKEQPKISEQIDVWSLGVTLYCLIYARIPFMAEDEFQMFRKIATEEVYIPRRRLRPVDPSTSPNATSLYKRQNKDPYRDDNDLEYEDVDNLLYDLLRQMLTKNPEKRIRLRDIKRHPWVVQGIANPIGWIDDTDPARPSSGRRIQVNGEEMSRAVVPLTFLERAKSAVKKAVGKVMHPLGDRNDTKSRRRATSSAASSSGDVPPTPHPRDNRRRSLRSEDYFSSVNSTEAGPQSNTTSPYESPGSVAMATVMHAGTSQSQHSLVEAEAGPSGSGIVEEPETLSSPIPIRPFQRHSQTRSMGQNFLPLTPSLPEAHTMPATPCYDEPTDEHSGPLRKTRDGPPLADDPSRSRSVDRGLFSSADKHAPPTVGLSTEVVPGRVHGPKHPRPMKSIDLGKAKHGNVSSGLSSPAMFSARAVAGYQHAHPNSDPNIHKRASAEIDERPRTAHRVETVPVCESPVHRARGTATPDSFAMGTSETQRLVEGHVDVDPANIACPPSPDEVTFPPAPSRGETMTTVKSSSLTSLGAVDTPLTSPSELTSPVSAVDFGASKANSQQMLAFQSDPSLPALLSGASSVSNDLELELLGQPGVVSTGPSLLETTDSLTPPAIAKDAVTGFALEQAFETQSSLDSGAIAVGYDAQAARGPDVATSSRASRSSRAFEDEDDDSGSDEGILMVKTTRKKKASDHGSHRTVFTARRRDTNASIASTETAKKLVVNSDEVTSHPEEP